MQEYDSKIRPLDQSIPCDALAGFRVVELTNYVAAPMCGRMLEDYGAEVIKIERPSGDTWRAFGGPPDENEKPLFDVLNSGKKSVVLNLKDPAEKEKLFKLLETADVFLTNSRMPALKKLGIDPETLREKFPSLVYGLITGYGIEGKDKDEPGFDSVSFWGRGGFLKGLSFTDFNHPIQYPVGVGDSITGSMLVSGILAALLKRSRTGKGDFVTISLLGAALWCLNVMVPMTQPKYGLKYPFSMAEANPWAYSYQCADGEWLQIGIMEYARYVPLMAEALGVPDLTHDPRFADEASAAANRVELIEIFERQFKTKTCAEWLELFKPLDIVCCYLPDIADVIKDEQAWANGNLQQFTMPSGNTCVMSCPPVRFGSTGSMKSKFGPRLGEHTEEVLDGL